MRKYAFYPGDIVRERTAEKKPIVGRVISCGSSAGHDYYKIESGWDIYNARDDELELVMRKRFALRREFPPIDEDEIDRFLLIWRPMSVDPPKDETCAVIWKTTRGVVRVSVMRWTGKAWVEEYGDGDKYHINRDVITAWALWEWPEIDQKPDGEEGVSDEAGADADPHHR